jgi:hypothetical protein
VPHPAFLWPGGSFLLFDVRRRKAAAAFAFSSNPCSSVKIRGSRVAHNCLLLAIVGFIQSDPHDPLDMRLPLLLIMVFANN